MHPHTFYSTLFEHDKRDEVFVIMSFSPEFDARWRQVIEPTIREDLNLIANRVDYNLSGESVVHDILDGIAHARLILADITSTAMTDPQSRVWPQRNGNVMWEVGIAHIMRLPDEVIMVRSDNDPSIFDLTQFRAFQYDPTNIQQGRTILKHLAEDRLRSIDQSKSDFVRRCADALDPHAVAFLLLNVPIDGQPFPIKTNMANAMMVPRLFELGILRSTTYEFVTGKAEGQISINGQASLTPLGRHVVEIIARQMGVWERLFEKKDD